MLSFVVIQMQEELRKDLDACMAKEKVLQEEVK
jgi:hypothetical protein